MTGQPAAPAPPPARPNRSATIYDIARECGVAPSTVSRAFSRPGRVSQATGERIRAAAARLGYRTDPPARAVPAGRSATVALLVSDVTNPVYFDVIRGVEVTAAGAGLTTLLADTRESSRFERQALDWAVPAAEALVLGSPRLPDSAIRAVARQRPTVVLNRDVVDVPSIVTDNTRGMHRALEHLRDLGHDTVTYLAGPEASWADGMRWRAIREAGAALGVRVRRIGPGRPTVAGGVAAVAELRRAPTTAVVAYNDLLAIGLMRGLARVGVVVPRDLSVVGFDNIFGSDFCTPALTTVAAPLRSLGTRAVEHLVAQLGGAPARTGTAMVLPVRLVVRDSTAQRRRKRTSPAWGTTRVSGSSTQPSRSTSAGSR